MSDVTPTAPTAPVATPPATPPAAPTAPDDSDHFVPQKDVDRILGERLGRERQKFETEYNSKLEGVKTATRAEVIAEYDEKLVNSSALSIAKDLGFHDPKDGLSVIDRAKLPMKDGAPDDEAIKAALEKLAGEKAYLVKEPVVVPTPRTPSGRPKLPTGTPPANGEPAKPMKAAEALRALRAKNLH